MHIRRCDVCGVLDSDDTPVRLVTIIGPRFDLCAEDRVAFMLTLHVPLEKAAAYVESQNTRVGKGGRQPALTVQDHSIGHRDDEDDTEDAETGDAETGDLGPVDEGVDSEGRSARKRKG